MRRIGVLAATLLCFGCANQPAAPPGRQAAARDLTAMAAIYGRLCLDSFPAEPAMQATLAALGASALPPGTIRRDPRVGPMRDYAITRDGTAYVATLDPPAAPAPKRSCTIRGTMAALPPSLEPYAGVLLGYVKSHGLALSRQVKDGGQTGRNRVDALIAVLAPPGAGLTHESSMVLVVHPDGDPPHGPYDILMAHRLGPPVAIPPAR